METQAPEAKTTCTVQTELSFQIAVCSISDQRTHGTNESNAKVRAETPTGNTKYSTIAATDLSWKQKVQEGETINGIYVKSYKIHTMVQNTHYKCPSRQAAD